MTLSVQSLILLLALLCASGCSLRSRWAIDDPDYAVKYKHAEQTAGQKVKQAFDARHVADGNGFYLSAAVAEQPVTVGGGIGGFYFPTSWLEANGGFTGLLGTGAGDALGGMNVGLRVHTPTRIAPFLGVGAAGAWSDHDLSDDGIDNDQDFLVDEDDENESRLFGAIYPEVGVHYWLNHRLRLTGSASYYVTTEGRDYDFWYYGLSLSFLGGG